VEAGAPGWRGGLAAADHSTVRATTHGAAGLMLERRLMWATSRSGWGLLKAVCQRVTGQAPAAGRSNPDGVARGRLPGTPPGSCHDPCTSSRERNRS
jgi:hypothetical protein